MNDQLLDPVLFGALALGGAKIWLDRRQRAAGLDEPVLPAAGKRGLWDRFWHPLSEPLQLGDGEVEFYEQHMRLLAKSGGFKTTMLASIFRQRLSRGRPLVVLTGGDSDQLEREVEAAGGWVIRPNRSPLTFNAFEGEPAFLAQGWAGLFPTTSDAKVYHSAFELLALRYFKSTTDYSVRGLRRFVAAYRPDEEDDLESGLTGRLIGGMREGYVAIRLGLMEEAFGSWIGNQLSVADCVRKRIPVMFVCDASVDPDLNRFSAALVWQAIQYAVNTVGYRIGGFDVLVDEIGRLPYGLVGTHLRTWRRNKCHFVGGSHNPDDFDEILEDLIHIQVLGPMVASATDTRQAASDMTWGTVHPTNFGEHAMSPGRTRLDQLLDRPWHGYFYLVDQRRVQLVKIPTWAAVPTSRVQPRVPYEEYARAAHFRRAQQIGAATCKELGHTPTRVARARGAVLGVVSPAGNGRTAQAPVEWVSWDELPGDERPAMPAMFDTPRLADLWRRHRFPRGDTPLWRDARDPRACWRVYLALKGKGKRPGLEFQGKPWQAYDLVLALASAEEMGIDDQDLPGFLLWLKIQLKSGKLSADHLCEEWMGTEAKLCIRREHLDWDDKLGNVAAHWDRWHAAKTAREGVA